MIVELTGAEMMIAALVASMRQTSNLRDGRAHRYGADHGRGWQNHAEGALGEMVIAKLLGAFWSGAVGDFEAADVGRIQVRSSSSLDARLILHEGDPDDDVFYLVVGTGPRFKVVGWIRGRDGKQPAFVSDPVGGRPAFFVPQDVLAPAVRIASHRP